MKTFIEFKKQRDLGEILSDTFGFLRNEFKPFFKTFFSVAGPAIVVFVITMGLYTYVVGDLFNLDIYDTSSVSSVNPFITIITLLAYVVAAVYAYVISISTVLNYIKSYIANKGDIELETIKKNVRQSFWGLTGLSFLKGITIVIATMLCVLPVFYVMIPMAIVFSIYIFEPRTSSSEAFSKSFKLANLDFWLAFGSFIILGILFYVLSMVFALPSIIYTWVKMGVFSGAIDPASMDTLIDPFYIILNVVNSLFQYLLNIILVIGGALIYFHLNEKENFTGTYERISQIGENSDQ